MAESLVKKPPISEQLKALQNEGKFLNLRRPEMPDPFAATEGELRYQSMFPAGLGNESISIGNGIDRRTAAIPVSADGYSRAVEGTIYSHHC